MSKIKACSETYASYKPQISTVITVSLKAIADQAYGPGDARPLAPAV